jgi:hypothetical protein
MTRLRLATALLAAASLGGAVGYQLGARRPTPRIEDARCITESDRAPTAPGEVWP